MTFFFLVRVARGFENKVSNDVANNTKIDGIPLKAILATPHLPGFIIVECERRFDLITALRGVSRARGIVAGKVTLEDALKYVELPEVRFKLGEVLDVVAGPFKGSSVRVIEDDGGSKIAVMMLDWEHTGRIVISKDQVRR